MSRNVRKRLSKISFSSSRQKDGEVSASPLDNSPVMLDCDTVDGDIGNISRLSSPPRHLPEVCVTEEEEHLDIFQMTEYGTPRYVLSRQIWKLLLTRGEELCGQLEEDDFYSSPGRSRLTPEPEQSQSSSYKSRRSLLSARRLSVSLVEGLLDIPFKQKRKTSAPIFCPIDQETVDNMKLKFINKKEVNKV